jgi:O-Antigen ligase
LLDPVVLTRGAARAIRRFEFIEWWIFWLLVAGLAWAPFRYGSNELMAWGINAMVFPGLAVLYEISLLIRGKPHPIGIRYVGVPGALFAAVVTWIAFQTSASVPSALVNPIWVMAADALGRPLEGSISVDRDLTNLALIRLITAASAFWLALQLCRNGARAGIIIQSVTVIGCLYAAYGLVVLKTGQLPWLDIPANGGRVSSTFVNQNSFATYAGMGLVAITGRLLQLYRDETIAAANWRLRLASFIEAAGGQGAALLGGGFLLMVALLLTGSRGGVASTGLALGVLCVLVHRHGGSRNRHRNRERYAPILFGLVLVTATLYAFGGVVTGNLDERGIADANRMSVYLLTLRSILDLPALGYGYGTFVDVFPMYRDQSISVAGIWGQAHDTYLEVFQGLGLVFGTVLIATVGLLALRCAKGSVRRQENAFVPAVAASAACLVGVHALVDFSLQMQAVALTFMAILGAGVAQSASSRRALED